jgi:glycosyltransferase involved in cell wall biosynthesis
VGFFHTNFIEYIDDYFDLPSVLLKLFQFISRFLIARNYNAYDATLTASAETSKKLTQMGIRNVICEDLLGIELDSFDLALRDRQFFAQTYGLPAIDRKLKLVFLGRLTPDKGWKFTLDACAQLAQVTHIDNLAIVIAGDGPMRDQIAAQLGQLGFSTALLGRVAPRDVPALLVNCDIHVTTSEKETRGLTLLEAFAAGIPVIAPRAGGVIDSIQPGQNGCLFEPGNQMDFISQLIALIHNSDLRQTLGRKARETVAHYTWENAVERLIQIWQQQIDRKSEG